MSSTVTRHFTAQPLGRQLGVAVLLSLVPALAVVVWTGVATLRERNAEALDQTEIIALTTAAYVNRSFSDVDLMARSMAQAPYVREMNPQLSEELFNRVALSRLDVMGIVLVSAEDGLIAGFHREPGEGDFPQTGVGRALDTGERVIESMDGPGRVQAVAWYPVDAEGGGVEGAMGFYLNLDGLQDVLATLPLPENAFVSLAAADGRVLVHGSSPELVGTVIPPHAEPGGPLVFDVRPGQDGIERSIAEVFLPDGPFVVRAGIPTAIALAEARTIWGRNATGVALGLVAWLGIAFVLTRRLTSSVDHLDAAAQRIAGGDLGPVDPQPMASRELAKLQQAFSTMVQRLDESRRELDRQMEEERGMRTEVQSLQSQVIRQERLAAVGQLVSGVAHEINNPLQAILGFAELLQALPDLPDSARKDLDLIRKESNRACSIIRNLATFARQQPGEAGLIQLHSVVTSVAELRQHRLELNGIELRIDDEARQLVRAVTTELQQVVLNFVVNAEQAMLAAGRRPGRITVRTRDVGDRVRLEVEDTGPGVDPGHEAKLFEPFFTTKPVGQGTGLGLSVSYGIIESMGGRLGYPRADSGGAIFYFELPAAPSGAVDQA